MFCHFEHSVSSCLELRKKSEREKNIYIFEMLDMIGELWACRVSVDLSGRHNQNHLINCHGTRVTIWNMPVFEKKLVEQSLCCKMDPHSFSFPYCRKAKNKKQINKAERITPTLASRIIPIRPEYKQCFYCKSSCHLIKGCEVYKQRNKKKKHKGNNLAKRTSESSRPTKPGQDERIS